MPAAVHVFKKANQILKGTDPAALSAARLAVTDANSVGEAIDAVGLLDGMDSPIAAEARAVLAALPQAVDRALLAALRSALDRRIPVGVRWVEGDIFELRVMEVADGNAGRVHIVVITPHGDTFVNS